MNFMIPLSRLTRNDSRQSAAYLNPVLTRRRVKRWVFQPRQRARVTLGKSSEKICTTKGANFNNASTLSRNYKRDDGERTRSLPPSSTPFFSREFFSAFSQRPAGAIPIARRAGCSSGNNAAGRIQSGEKARGTDGVRLIELVVRDFPAASREEAATAAAQTTYYSIQSDGGMGVERGGKKREAMSIDVMKPVSRKAPYRGWRGTNLFAPRRL